LKRLRIIINFIIKDRDLVAINRTFKGGGTRLNKAPSTYVNGYREEDLDMLAFSGDNL
jgi:hypothetical protein